MHNSGNMDNNVNIRRQDLNQVRSQTVPPVIPNMAAPAIPSNVQIPSGHFHPPPMNPMFHEYMRPMGTNWPDYNSYGMFYQFPPGYYGTPHPRRLV